MTKASMEVIQEEEMAERKEEVNSEALARYLKLEEERKGARRRRSVDMDSMNVRRSVIADYDGLSVERILNKSDLFPIAHLRIGLNAAKSVCRISIRSRNGRVLSYGTGFLVARSLILTNNHVLNNAETARYSIVDFNYEDDEKFIPRPLASFRLDPDRFFMTDEKLDYTLVAVLDDPNNERQLAEYGCLELMPQEGKVLEGEYVSIIQHLQGGPKAVTVRENEIAINKKGSIINNILSSKSYLTT
jgi:endonuclease G